MKAFRLIKEFATIHRQKLSQAEFDVQFYNCWQQSNQDMYWQQFVSSRHILPAGKKMAVFSVFGPRRIVRCVDADLKIFFTAENLKNRNYHKYADHCLSESGIDLAMGFEVFEDPRYIRFPLWMDYMFPAESTPQDIRRICGALRFPSVENKEKFCCMVASNSADGLRDEMLDKISEIARVDSAGRYRHNDDSLLTECGDDKKTYLRRYQFNICPENTSAYGYVTEKLFESISQGCIPIYWGADVADKDIVNMDAVISWDRKDGGKSALAQLAELHSNPQLLQKFLKQPRLCPTAEEKILDTFSAIEERMVKLLG